MKDTTVNTAGHRSSTHRFWWRSTNVNEATIVRDIIQGLWVGDSLSNMEKLCMRSFLENGHPYHLYTYNDVEGVPEGVKILDANQIIPRERVFLTGGVDNKPRTSLAGFSDLFRYKLLLDRGGWWVDTDFVCLKPFDFTTPYVFTGDGDSISPGFVKVPAPNDPMIKQVYDVAEKIYGPDMKWGGISGLIKCGVVFHQLYGYKLDPQLFLSVNRHELLSHALGERLKTIISQAYTIHCWNEDWRANGLDKNGQFPSGSLYEKLLRRYGVKK